MQFGKRSLNLLPGEVVSMCILAGFFVKRCMVGYHRLLQLHRVCVSILYKDGHSR